MDFFDPGPGFFAEVNAKKALEQNSDLMARLGALEERVRHLERERGADLEKRVADLDWELELERRKRR